jgi:hypothetical protein
MNKSSYIIYHDLFIRLAIYVSINLKVKIIFPNFIQLLEGRKWLEATRLMWLIALCNRGMWLSLYQRALGNKKVRQPIALHVLVSLVRNDIKTCESRFFLRQTFQLLPIMSIKPCSLCGIRAPKHPHGITHTHTHTYFFLHNHFRAQIIPWTRIIIHFLFDTCKEKNKYI